MSLTTLRLQVSTTHGKSRISSLEVKLLPRHMAFLRRCMAEPDRLYRINEEFDAELREPVELEEDYVLYDEVIRCAEWDYEVLGIFAISAWKDLESDLTGAGRGIRWTLNLDTPHSVAPIGISFFSEWVSPQLLAAAST